MNGFLSVMIGGAIGAGTRYGVGLWSARLFGVSFPWGTLAVNLVGGLAMGLLIGRGLGDGWRLFAGVGVLGGFTTFSAFGLESWSMIERGATGAAFGYIAASVLGAVLLTGFGLWIARA
jgi:fluoride exporter